MFTEPANGWVRPGGRGLPAPPWGEPSPTDCLCRALAVFGFLHFIYFLWAFCLLPVTPTVIKVPPVRQGFYCSPGLPEHLE